MFNIEVNHENASIQIKKNDSEMVAEGRFAVDRADPMVLVRIIQTTISTDDHQQLHNLISAVHDHFGKMYKGGIIVRLPPAFDNKIDRNKPELKNDVSEFMTVTMSDLKCDDDNLIRYDREQYALVTDKQEIVVYTKQIMMFMNVEAFWATHWDEQKVHDRILSASAVAMIFDKANKVPVGIGRMFKMRNNNDNEEETLGYLSDIVVHIQHQGKGLGKVIINHLVGAYIGRDLSQRPANGLLCLVSADRGSGAISASKLYRSFGFEHLNKIDNRIGIFLSEKYYVKQSV
jgi:ribosomal protein S18 acetylase RimI-like enzyme